MSLPMPAPAERRHTRRNVVVSGRRTSIRMERLFWTCLEEMCRERGAGIADVLTEIDGRRGDLSLTAAVRLHVVAAYHRRLVPAGGERRAS